jgi:hypothetical protein
MRVCMRCLIRQVEAANLGQVSERVRRIHAKRDAHDTRAAVKVRRLRLRQACAFLLIAKRLELLSAAHYKAFWRLRRARSLPLAELCDQLRHDPKHRRRGRRAHSTFTIRPSAVPIPIPTGLESNRRRRCRNDQWATQTGRGCRREHVCVRACVRACVPCVVVCVRVCVCACGSAEGLGGVG